MTTDEKLEKLATILRGYGSLLVAFSGGVDSTFLLKVAVDTLGEKVAAFTEASPLHQSWELTEARELAKQFGVRHIVIEADELEDPEFAQLYHDVSRPGSDDGAFFGSRQSRAGAGSRSRRTIRARPETGRAPPPSAPPVPDPDIAFARPPPHPPQCSNVGAPPRAQEQFRSFAAGGYGSRLTPSALVPPTGTVQPGGGS